MYKALIVDDEPQARDYLAQIIPRISPLWEIVGSAANGADALNIYNNQPADLVITDIRMPEMDGFQLGKALRQIDPNVLIVYVSGYDEFAYAQEAIQIGVSDYLLKPISRKDIQMLLDKAEQKLSHTRDHAKQLEMYKQLSDEYRNELIRNLCQAALENNYIRIQTIQPLLYRMQVQELQKDWCVIAAFAENDLSSGFEQWAQNRYLFLQIVRSLVEVKLRYGYVVEANDGTLLLCISGSNEKETDELADQVISAAEKLCTENLHVPISSCKSNVKMDILELHEAHREADNLFTLSAILGGGRYNCNMQDKRADKLKEQGQTLIEVWRHEDIISLPAFIMQYCQLLPNNNYQYGILHLLHQAHKAFCPHLQTIEKQLLQLSCKSTDELAYSVTEIILNAMNGKKERTVNEKLIDDAVVIIRMNLAQPISLGFIADRLKVSANHLSRLFHTVVGESYIHFLTRERMEFAAKLLRQSAEMKIYDVAEKTGYFNIQHFCHVFRQYWGMTPTQYQHNDEEEKNSTDNQ